MIIFATRNKQTTKFAFLHLKFLVMVYIRIVFRNWISKDFFAFSFSEAYDILNQFKIDNIISIHIYPNYHS